MELDLEIGWCADWCRRTGEGFQVLTRLSKVDAFGYARDEPKLFGMVHRHRIPQAVSPDQGHRLGGAFLDDKRVELRKGHPLPGRERVRSGERRFFIFGGEVGGCEVGSVQKVDQRGVDGDYEQ